MQCEENHATGVRKSSGVESVYCIVPDAHLNQIKVSEITCADCESLLALAVRVAGGMVRA